MLEEGYKIGDIQVEPQVVKVTGGKDVISQVSLVKAVIEVEAPVNETIKQKAFVTVLDKNLNKLDVPRRSRGSSSNNPYHSAE